MSDEPIECPFCHEKDFDLVGLRLHLVQGHCDIYEEMPTVNPVRTQKLEAAKKKAGKVLEMLAKSNAPFECPHCRSTTVYVETRDDTKWSCGECKTKWTISKQEPPHA